MKTKEDLIEKWVSASLLAQKAYHVPDSVGFIKLDAMENPYPLPEALRTKWQDVLQSQAINRYPDAQANSVKNSLRAIWQLSETQHMVLGNGSDELILLLSMLVRAPNRKILSVDPSFVMYRIIAENLGLEYINIPLEPDFQLPPEAILDAIIQHEPAIIFLAYPNNPTGNLFEIEQIIEIIEASPGLVVIDEAYYPFAQGHTFLPFLGKYPNLLVMRTLSKVGFAGLRLGVLIGDPLWIEQIDKLRLPYNINILTQASISFLAQHIDTFHQQAEKICLERAKLEQILQLVPQIEVFPSAANFLLMRVPDADSLFEALKQNKILIKNLNKPGLLENCLRVTVGTNKENVAFLKALEKSIH